MVNFGVGQREGIKTQTFKEVAKAHPKSVAKVNKVKKGSAKKMVNNKPKPKANKPKNKK